MFRSVKKRGKWNGTAYLRLILANRRQSGCSRVMRRIAVNIDKLLDLLTNGSVRQGKNHARNATETDVVYSGQVALSDPEHLTSPLVAKTQTRDPNGTFLLSVGHNQFSR